MSSGRALRDKMADGGMARIMSAHNPLSACLAEEAGFDGIWASGFELSASQALPDVSLVSMDQHLEVTRRMVERISIPVVADIDTGFGNAINVLHAVEQYERAGAAAVVIEDKTFPKVTSLIDGGRQELLRLEEFQGKIEAAIEARRDPGFMIIARTEALIAGLGEAEALARAAAYEEAGADMILIHSKQKTPDEVESFVANWTGKARVTIVPTAYPEMTEARARATGKIGMYIYGNHSIRAAVTAMREILGRIARDGGFHEVENDIVSVQEVFDLQDMARVKRDEGRFLR